MAEFIPVRGVIARLPQLDLAWHQVVEDLDHACVTPVPGNATRLRYRGERVDAFVEPGRCEGREVWWVVGLHAREAVEPLPRQLQVVGHEPRHRKSGAHGGGGQRWPTTWRELIARIEAHPEAEVRQGGKHLNVLLRGRQVQALPVTASDHRALLNACQILRGHGIDVRRAS